MQPDFVERILRLMIGLLPAGLRARVHEGMIIGLVQFTRFAIVGFSGFTVDTLCVYAFRSSLGLYGAGMLAWFIAVGSNWMINRLWTFRGQGGGSARAQFVRYALVNIVGFVLNRGAYVLMVTFVAVAAAEPILATATGAVAGMFANFFLSRALVFR